MRIRRYLPKERRTTKKGMGKILEIGGGMAAAGVLTAALIWGGQNAANASDFGTIYQQWLVPEEMGSYRDESAGGGYDVTVPEEEKQETARTGVDSRSSADDWNLILVNRWNLIPDDYEVSLTQLQNNQAVDSRIYPELQQMFDDARAAGILPSISSSYRTAEKQQELMDEKIDEYLAQGYGEEEAKRLAEEWVAIPGTSEHQIGIAVDITTESWLRQDASVVWQWLDENCYKYGFILRYPENKTDITGVMHEPWHYRYVGKEVAKEIYEKGVCLEEYLGKVQG